MSENRGSFTLLTRSKVDGKIGLAFTVQFQRKLEYSKGCGLHEKGVNSEITVFKAKLFALYAFFALPGKLWLKP